MGSDSRTEDRPSSSKHSRSSTRSHRTDADGDRSSKRHRSSRDDDKQDSKHKHSHSSRRDRSTSRDRSSRKSSSRRDRDVDPKPHRRSRSAKDKDAGSDDDEWVEKTAESTGPPVDSVGTFSVGSMPTTQGLRRLEGQDLTDGYGEGDVGGSSERGGGLFGGIPKGEGAGGEMDFFGSFGTEKRRNEPKEKPDPSVRLFASRSTGRLVDSRHPLSANDGPVVARVEQGLLAGRPRRRVLLVCRRRVCRPADQRLARTRLDRLRVAHDQAQAHVRGRRRGGPPD